MAGRVEQGKAPMAEPPLTTPLEVASSGQQVLLATKLHLPQPPPGFTPRPRLVVRAQ